MYFRVSSPEKFLQEVIKIAVKSHAVVYQGASENPITVCQQDAPEKYP